MIIIVVENVENVTNLHDIWWRDIWWRDIWWRDIWWRDIGFRWKWNKWIDSLKAWNKMLVNLPKEFRNINVMRKLPKLCKFYKQTCTASGGDAGVMATVLRRAAKRELLRKRNVVSGGVSNRIL